ncbi:hypothetical protein AOXY_G29773 [Acipenser oxyrinchus oxyrinchus]|uniref:Ig-like domain-containing protein n=1 Tax=Acipenser oxyrinchus oxyrinchus TaxID=40147 RepID=A0AAD8CP09_ACIOX|nr:hypothetical protein AOXY_G29773 [Acipenser oxyrinchus oxyrinchus]
MPFLYCGLMGSALTVYHSSLPGIFSQTIHQTPLFISKFPRDTVKMDCSVKGTSSPNMYWYRQDSSGGIEMLFLSIAAGMVDESPIKDFTAQRTDSESFTLQTESLSLNHSAVYYCAWSSHGD